MLTLTPSKAFSYPDVSRRERHRDILGMWAGEHGDGEGAKFRLRVLSTWLLIRLRSR